MIVALWPWDSLTLSIKKDHFLSVFSLCVIHLPHIQFFLLNLLLYHYPILVFLFSSHTYICCLSLCPSFCSSFVLSPILFFLFDLLFPFWFTNILHNNFFHSYFLCYYCYPFVMWPWFSDNYMIHPMSHSKSIFLNIAVLRGWEIFAGKGGDWNNACLTNDVDWKNTVIFLFWLLVFCQSILSRRIKSIAKYLENT